MANYKVALDAGHGGSDPGAVYNGRQEKMTRLTSLLQLEIFLKMVLMFSIHELPMNMKHPSRRLQMPIIQALTCLYRYTAIPLKLLTSTQVSNLWYSTTPVLRQRLQEI